MTEKKQKTAISPKYDHNMTIVCTKKGSFHDTNKKNEAVSPIFDLCITGV
jgi:hypothetical protein